MVEAFGLQGSFSRIRPVWVAGVVFQAQARNGLQGLFCTFKPGEGCRLHFAGSSPRRVAGPVVQVHARKGLQAPVCRFRPVNRLQGPFCKLRPMKGCRPINAFYTILKL